MIIVEGNVLPQGEVSIKHNRIFVDGKDFTPITKNGNYKITFAYQIDLTT
jgi:hypothetical protein